jgi:hypothetical protein
MLQQHLPIGGQLGLITADGLVKSSGHGLAPAPLLAQKCGRRLSSVEHGKILETELADNKDSFLTKTVNLKPAGGQHRPLAQLVQALEHAAGLIASTDVKAYVILTGIISINEEGKKF